MTRAYGCTLMALLCVSAAGAGASCLQDLPPDVAPDAAAPPSEVVCGDGYVDLEAGEQCDPGPNSGPASLEVCSASCQVECSGGLVWPTNNHCYQVAPNASDLDPDAITQCSGGHVVTFGSEAEFRAVAAASNVGPFWVGLTTSASRPYVSEVSYEPGWAATCSGCYAHTPNPNQALPRYPETGMVAEQCVAAFSDSLVASWSQYPCFGEPNTYVVCEREPVGVQFSQCEAGTCVDLVVTRGQKRYIYESTPAAADSAEAECNASGGRLLVLQSRDEREQLWRQLSQMDEPPDRIWIGLSLVPSGGAGDGDAGEPGDAGDGADARTTAWVWDDGTPADGPTAYPPPWGDLQPAVPGETTRAYLRHSPGGIDDTLARNDEAETALPFVCEFAAGGP